MNRANVVESHGTHQVVVVGSCFLDYIAYVDRIPQVGETLHSKVFEKGFGGKGANQAVAAGRLGAAVAMVSMVGDDGDGADYIAALQKNGVDASHVYRQPQSASGLAMIFVDTKSSQNEIVICPNATQHLTPDHLRSKSNDYNDLFPRSCRFLICQNEIPLDTTLDVLRAASRRGIYTVFNAAPAPSAADVARIKPFLSFVSLFCPNEIEAAMITGVDVTDGASAARAARALQSLGVRDVVITLGSKGYLICEKGAQPEHVKGIRVKAVDTTGAGDCFVGSMVFFMAKGKSLKEACRRANICASICVQRKGTQKSYAMISELPADLLE